MLSQISPSPLVDYVCRAKIYDHTRLRELDILLFAVQHKGRDERTAVQQLAKAFQPMMILFVLYYLDLRTSREDLMPWWMVLFGATYDEHGISIQSFFPAFNYPESTTSQDMATGWAANSWNISKRFAEHLRLPPYKRNGMLASLFRIQGHCRYVLEQLKHWDGYERACAKVYS
jgi:hypothetical protein